MDVLYFLCLEICRQCRGKLDKELSEGTFMAGETAATATPDTTPSECDEQVQEETYCIEEESTAAVRTAY